MARPIKRVVPLLVGAETQAGTDQQVLRGPVLAQNAEFPLRGLAQQRRGLSSIGYAFSSGSIAGLASQDGVNILAVKDGEASIRETTGLFETIGYPHLKTQSLKLAFDASGTDGAFDAVVTGSIVAVAIGQQRPLSGATYDAITLKTYHATSGRELDSLTISESRPPTVVPSVKFVDFGGGTAHMFFVDGTSINAYAINTSTGAINTTKILMGTKALAADYAWDVGIDAASGYGVLATSYYDGSTYYYVSAKAFDSSLTAIGSAVDTGGYTTAIHAISVSELETSKFSVLFAYGANPGTQFVRGVRYAVTASTFTVDKTVSGAVTVGTTSSTPIWRIVAKATTSNATLAHCDWTDDDGNYQIRKFDVDAAGSSLSVSSPTLAVSHCQLASCPDSDGVFLAVLRAHDDQRTIFAVNPYGTDGSTVAYRVIGKFRVDQISDLFSGWNNGTSGVESRPMPLFDGSHVAILRKLRGAVRGAAGAGASWLSNQGLGVVAVEVYDFATVTQTRMVGDDASTLISASVPQVYDGRNIKTHGWLCYPDRVKIVGSTASGAGSNIPTGYLRYVATYDAYDARGRLIASSPLVTAVEFDNTSGVNKSANVYVPSPVDIPGVVGRVTVYRTQSSTATNPPGPFYLVDSIEIDGTANTITVNDSYSDSEISDEAKVYTTGGVIEHIQPPPGNGAQCMWAGRHVVANAETPGELRYSVDVEPGGVIDHSDYLSIAVTAGDDITALHPLSSQTLAVFTRRSTYTVSGQPLDNLAQGVGFAAPQLVSDVVGCTSQPTIVDTPAGVMFASEDGIYLLSYGGQLANIGDAMRDILTDKAIVSAAAWRDGHMALFVLDSEDGNAIAAYDWVHDAWSYWPTGVSVGAICDLGDNIIVASQYAYVLTIASSRGSDNGSYYGFAAETGWLQIPGQGTRQRVIKLIVEGYQFRAGSTGTLQVKIAYDNEVRWSDVQTYDLSDIDVFGHDGYLSMTDADATYAAMIIPVYPSRTRCHSVKIRISDAGSGGESIGLTQLSAVVSSYGLGARPQDRVTSGGGGGE